MNGGTRLFVGVAAIGLVISALGIAAPASSEIQPVRTEISVNR